MKTLRCALLKETIMHTLQSETNVHPSFQSDQLSREYNKAKFTTASFFLIRFAAATNLLLRVHTHEAAFTFANFGSERSPRQQPLRTDWVLQAARSMHRRQDHI